MSNPITPYARLQHSAEAWHTEGYYSESIILLQTAVELFTEQTFDHLCRQRNIQYLRDQLERLLFNNYNLAHDKVVSLYEALAGDEIRQQSFWSEFKKHAELRNDIVHDGRNATKAESERSLRAVSELIDYVKTANSL